MPITTALLALFGLAGQVGSVPAAAPAAPTVAARVVATFPHDPRAFTEGLFWLDGYLYESTGELDRSGIRKVDLRTGKVLQSVAVNPPLYGEGIAPWRDQILSLTWKNQIGFRWQRSSFKRIASFSYNGEGWALTGDGTDLIMSDGSAVLRYVDPETFKVKRLLSVTDAGRPVRMLNELEYVDGEILANVWLTDRIARIDPASGEVIGWIDVSALHRQAGNTATDDIPNGIAWDARGRHLYVTGKDWPILFEIRPPKDPAPAP